MTELSPAAQAVDTALAACIQLQGEIIRARPLAAAALEAVANEVVPTWDKPSWDYELVMGNWQESDRVRRKILAIAAELRGNTTTTETP